MAVDDVQLKRRVDDIDERMVALNNRMSVMERKLSQLFEDFKTMALWCDGLAVELNRLNGEKKIEVING